MERFIRTFLFLGLVLGLSQCNDSDDLYSGKDFQRKDIELTRGEAEIACNQYGFSVDLLKSAYGISKDGNVLLSPLSLSMILGQMTAAIDEADRDELYEALSITSGRLDDYHEYSGKLISELPGMDTHSVLKIDNGFWLKDDGVLAPEYESVLKEKYQSSVERFTTFDSFVIGGINSWINERTSGLIPNLLTPEDIILALDYVWTNTLYFKGAWRQKFDKSETSARPFYVSYPDQTNVMEVQMMEGSSFRYSHTHYASNVSGEDYKDAIQTAILPYGNESFMFTAVLPSINNPDIASTLETLTPEYWQNIDRIVSIPKSSGDILVRMPKMHIESRNELIHVLKNMGVEKIFEKMSVKENLGFDDDQSIRLLRQNLVFDQDEEGAVIVVASSGGGGYFTDNIKPMIIFDRPFIYFIRERSTGAVLLAGVYSHP